MMKQNMDVKEKLSQLRRQADEMMRDKTFVGTSPGFENPFEFIHELQTLQIELEMQIDEFERSQQELMEAKARYSELYDFAPVGYITVNLKGVILNANLTFADMVSTERGSLVNQPLSAHIVFEDQDIYYLHLRALSESDERQSCDLRMQNKDHVPFHVQLQSTVVLNGCKEPDHFRTVVIDTSERREAEERSKKFEIQLQQSQKMESIGTLAGGIAHDFNNILSPIIGHAEILLEDLPQDSIFRESLDEIYSASIRAKDLVKQILTFSRQNCSELKLMKIEYVIKEALSLIRPLIPTTIAIKQDIKGDCGLIRADPTQIHQIVMNLAINASHAMEKTGGELKVSLKEVEVDGCDTTVSGMAPGHYVCLIVADTGTGMDRDVREKIFTPFFTTKKKDRGTGMGLSVVHGIVKNAGGTIQVCSEPGRGTKFHVYLPVAPESFSEEKHAVTKKEILQRGSEQILIVDDEKNIMAMEKRILERLGYKVTSCTSSVEALEIFRNTPDKFDLVITDMAMPLMSGDRLAIELIKISPDIPIVLCTGYSEIISEKKALDIGFKGFLLKPIGVRDFSRKIRDVLNGHTR